MVPRFLIFYTKYFEPLSCNDAEILSKLVSLFDDKVESVVLKTETGKDQQWIKY